MANLTMVRFVDDGFLYKQSGYLHAKALYIDADEQQQVLITGSANPSAPAWLAHTGARNAEAMIFRSGPEASHIADRLGLKTLGEQPQLSSERWKHLSISSFAIPRPADGPIHSFAIAVETADGFLLPMLDLHLEYLQAIHLLNENAVRLPFPSKVGQDTTGLTINCGRDLRSSVRYIAVQLKDGRELLALVHHTTLIERQALSNRQVQFRAAFVSLRGDKPDLVQLMGIIEKIVFDETGVPNVSRSRKGRPANASQDDVSEDVASLAIHLDETRKRRKQPWRLVETGDLGYLLDVLIHHVRSGLELTGHPVETYGRSEEEQIGADDEDVSAGLTEVDVRTICQKKVHALGTRILKKLGQAAQQESSRIATLVQLTVVFAVLRELRSLDGTVPWVPLGETLVPLQERQRLFHGALSHLFGRQAHGDKARLFDAALGALDAEPMEEISKLLGLLLWLAWDSGVSVSALDERRLSWPESLDKARLLVIAPRVATDPIATHEARDSILKSVESNRRADAVNWLRRVREWGQTIAGYTARLKDLPRCSDTVQAGDIAFAPDAPDHDRCLRVVLGWSGTYISLADLNEENPQLLYLPDRVSKLAVAAPVCS
jgi:hypothetical protein